MASEFRKETIVEKVYPGLLRRLFLSNIPASEWKNKLFDLNIYAFLWHELLIKQRPIQTSVLNRLQQMRRFDILGSGEVGNRAGDF